MAMYDVTMEVTCTTRVDFELDVPDEIIAEGEHAVRNWIQANAPDWREHQQPGDEDVDLIFNPINDDEEAGHAG